MFDFRILGPLEVADESGRLLALGGQKQRALLGLLLIHAGRVVSVDRLIDGLWGERPPKTATTSLQNFIGQLRKLLGPEIVVTRPPGYLLRVGPGQLDLGRFEQLVSEAKRSGTAERSKRLREALALWRGPPLADLSFESFAQTEIRRLEELRLDALEERIEADLELGLSGELVGELEALVEAHPLRERLCRQLMLALYRSGRQAEALATYHEARRMLAEQLGVDPTPALQQVYRAILRQETGLEPGASRSVADPHADVVKALLAGRLVTVLGAGGNLGGADDALPALADVATYLAECFECPTEHERDLARVSQYVSLMKGIGPLYDELHGLFDRDYVPGPAHRCLAGLAGVLREHGAPGQLLVTTNFDMALERALADAGEEFDLVSYIALGRHRGKFMHLSAGGEATVIDVPNAYTGLALEERTVILKLHGQVDRRPDREWESFVVSEDDHIDYLAQADVASLVPVTLIAKLRRSHFLFLGYPLRDWGLRVFLHRIFGRERVSYRSWALVEKADPLERELWRQRGIEVLDVSPEDYMEELVSRAAEVARRKVSR